MQPHTRQLLDLALEFEALKFGEFTLKSGRISPYFFNLGTISSGSGMTRLSGCYADRLTASGIAFDSLFGPAYKGSPLVAGIACALADRGRGVGCTYHRKDAQDDGEGGRRGGAPLGGGGMSASPTTARKPRITAKAACWWARRWANAW